MKEISGFDGALQASSKPRRPGSWASAPITRRRSMRSSSKPARSTCSCPDFPPYDAAALGRDGDRGGEPDLPLRPGARTSSSTAEAL